MEKKVLLKDLVDSGTHIRKQIVSKVRVTDNGVYPIGELWDANTTLDVIVNGAHSQHDTIREVDTFAHDLDTKKVDRITVDDIQNIPASKLDSLKAGDVVIKTTGDKTHAYTVAYKKGDEASLVYADHENIEEVYYEKQSGVWTYVQTDNMPLQFKTVSGQSIIGSGNIDVQTIVTANELMPASWDKNHTMTELIADINADTDAIPGKIYLSTVHLTDLPGGMSLAELKVEIMGQQAGKKILLFSITSADISPYRWEYTSYNMADGPWRSWLPSNTVIPTIPTNVSTFNNDAGYITEHQDLSSIISRIEALELAAGITSSEPV